MEFYDRTLPHKLAPRRERESLLSYYIYSWRNTVQILSECKIQF